MEAGIECLAYVVRWQKRKQLMAEKNDRDKEGESDTDVSLHLRPPFRDIEKRQPRQCDRDTEGALARLKEDIKVIYASCLNKTTKPNTTREERRALKELRNNNSIIVKLSDKCKGFMVLDGHVYLQTKEYPGCGRCLRIVGEIQQSVSRRR